MVSSSARCRGGGVTKTPAMASGSASSGPGPAQASNVNTMKSRHRRRRPAGRKRRRRRRPQGPRGHCEVCSSRRQGHAAAGRTGAGAGGLTRAGRRVHPAGPQTAPTATPSRRRPSCRCCRVTHSQIPSRPTTGSAPSSATHPLAPPPRRLRRPPRAGRPSPPPQRPPRPHPEPHSSPPAAAEAVADRRAPKACARMLRPSLAAVA